MRDSIGKRLSAIQQAIDSLTQAVKKYQQSEDTQKQQQSQTEIKAVVRLPEEIGEYCRSKQGDRPVQNRRDKIRLGLEIVGILVALGIAYLTYSSLGIFNGQLGAMQRQTEISERPWLDVEASPEAGLVWVNGKQVAVSVTFTVTNAGHSIAKDVWIAAKMFPSVPGLPVAVDAQRNQDVLCTNPTLPPVGLFDLFPTSKPRPQVLGISAAPDAVVSQAVALSTDRQRIFVGLYVVGCANYRYSFAKDVHQTRFAYELIAPPAMPPSGGPFMLANGNMLMTGFEVGVNTPLDKLKLMPELFAQNSAN